MAGFNITGNNSEYQKSNVAETRRKHRWVFSKLGDVLQQGELIYLKSAARPKFDFEEVTMHHDQEEAYFAGKQKWSAIDFEWYDVQQPVNVSKKLWDWLGIVNPKLADKNGETCVNAPRVYKGRATLEMTGNCDTSRGEETWDFYGMWPKSCDWSSLDYSTNEILMIKVNARYDKAMRTK